MTGSEFVTLMRTSSRLSHHHHHHHHHHHQFCLSWACPLVHPCTRLDDHRRHAKLFLFCNWHDHSDPQLKFFKCLLSLCACSSSVLQVPSEAVTVPLRRNFAEQYLDDIFKADAASEQQQSSFLEEKMTQFAPCAIVPDLSMLQ